MLLVFIRKAIKLFTSLTRVRLLDYVLIADWHFMTLALRELRAMLGVPRLEIPRRLSDGMVIVKAGAGADEMAGLVAGAKPVFIDMLLPLLATAAADGGYGSIADAIKRVLDKGTTFKIEAVRMGSVVKDKAKDVEVRLGNMLEAQGFRADMNAPSCMVYVILHGKEALVGRVDGGGTMDWFRASNRMHSDPLNRSELKLNEAVGHFGIGMGDVHRCLDIGAAPGGWTDYMAMNGKTVVAVDGAMLEYKRLCRYGSIVVAVGGGVDGANAVLSKIDSNIFAVGMVDAAAAYEKYRPAVLHVKSDMDGETAELLSKLPKFDMAMIDANVAPEEACSMAEEAAAYLRSGGVLVLTIKLVDKKIEERIKYVKGAISKEYEPVALKKLPHNRMEVTLFARRRQT